MFPVPEFFSGFMSVSSISCVCVPSADWIRLFGDAPIFLFLIRDLDLVPVETGCCFILFEQFIRCSALRYYLGFIHSGYLVPMVNLERGLSLLTDTFSRSRNALLCRILEKVSK